MKLLKTNTVMCHKRKSLMYIYCLLSKMPFEIIKCPIIFFFKVNMFLFCVNAARNNINKT